jgi:putative DNA primase/helicase
MPRLRQPGTPRPSSKTGAGEGSKGSRPSKNGHVGNGARRLDSLDREAYARKVPPGALGGAGNGAAEGFDAKAFVDEATSLYLSFGAYRIKPDGLFHVRQIKVGKKVVEQETWISGGFKVLGRVRDPAGNGWGSCIEWLDEERREHQRVIDDGELHGDLGPLCAMLASGGLKIILGTTRKHLGTYLNQVRSRAPRRLLVPRTGWHIVGDGARVFALPGRDGEIIVANATASPYRSAGCLEDWKREVARPCGDHHLAVFAVSTAIAAALLGLVAESGGGANLKGMSSTGKTTLLCAAASVWGSGSERGGYIKTWRGTGNGLEGAAALYTDTLLALDELGVAHPVEVGNIVYSLAAGVGKQRARQDGSAKTTATWSVMILSSGELGVGDKIKEGGGRARAGQENRVIDISADAGHDCGVFDSPGPDGPQRLANEIKAAAAKCYGTAGPAFVDALVKTGLDACIDRARGIQADFRADVAGNVKTGQVLRVADRLGLIAAAGEMAINLGIVDWAPGTAVLALRKVFESWSADRGGDDPAEIRMAIEQVAGMLEQHGAARVDPVERVPDTRPVPNRLGFIHGTGAEREWLIPPETWRGEFLKGFDVKMISKVLVERGLLRPGTDGKTSKMARAEGRVTRFYVLPMVAWGSRNTEPQDRVRDQSEGEIF